MSGRIVYGFDLGAPEGDLTIISIFIDGKILMTNREFLELKERLQKATNKELAQVYLAMGEKDPFKNSLLLPSKIREGCITQIEKWFRNGVLTAKKNA